ncbi:MAG: HAD family hydrolase [Spirochaetales bacterium]|nr:HAD family hydrolase [Spirochaetales bacterium]
MKVIYLPQIIEALVFDIDLTLYDSRDYYRSQTDLLVKRLSGKIKKTVDETKLLVEEKKRDMMAGNGGKEISLGNVFLTFGVSIEENARWRSELFAPEKYLLKDLKLMEVLRELNLKYAIAAITNNSKSIGERTLKALGIEKFFKTVIGLDDTFVSKPHIKPLQLLSKRLGMPFNRMVSIGDRMAVDVELPVTLGMGGILVDSMQDVYSLPRVFNDLMKS